MTLATPTPPWGTYKPELWNARGSGQTAVGVLGEALDRGWLVPVREARSHASCSVPEPEGRAGLHPRKPAGGRGRSGREGFWLPCPGGPPACLLPTAPTAARNLASSPARGTPSALGAASGRDTKPQVGRCLLGAGRPAGTGPGDWRGPRAWSWTGPNSRSALSSPLLPARAWVLGGRPALVTPPGGLLSGLSGM